MKYLLTVCTLLACLAGYTQPRDWEWQNPRPSGNDFNATCFLNARKGFMLGDYGTLFKTLDGGVSWNRQRVSANLYGLNAMSFSDSLHGWVVGDSGTILKTVDGGNNWVALPNIIDTSYLHEWYNLYDVNFRNDSVGFVTCVPRCRSCGWNWGILFRTADGGATWARCQSKIDRGSSSVTSDGFGQGWYNQRQPFRITFTSDSVGWAVMGYTEIGTSTNHQDLGAVYKTTDSGKLWVRHKYSPPLIQWWPDLISDNVTSSFILNDTTVWLITRNSTLRRTANGRTWTADASIGPHIGNLQFKNAREGWMTDVAYDSATWLAPRYLYHTLDSGRSWSLRPLPGHFKNVYSLRILADGSLYLTGPGGSWAKTSDGGLTYQTPAEVHDLHAIHFSNDLNGFAVGDSGAILHTADGGRTWVLKHRDISWTSLTSVHVLNDRIAWVAGGYRVYKTVDGGATWDTTGPLQDPVKSIFFLNETHGWAAGEGDDLNTWPGLSYTVDGGATWTRREVVDTLWGNFGIPGGRQIQFYDDSLGWGLYSFNDFSGSGSRLYRYSGGGQQYEEGVLPDSAGPLYAFHFLDSLNGWAVGRNLNNWRTPTMILRTQDGGNTWFAISNLMTDWANAWWSYAKPASIRFIDEKRGWFVGNYNGSVWYTADGGYTWNEQVIKAAGTAFNSLWFNPGGHGWAAGTNGAIAHFKAEPLPDLNIVTGKVYLRADTNCVQDGSERGMSGQVVKAEPGPYYATTNGHGEFRLAIPDTGTFRISQVLTQQRYIHQRQLCPDSGTGYTVRFGSTGNETHGLNFADEIDRCALLTVSVASNRRRPCFTSLTTVSYGNSGADSAQGAVAHVKLPQRTYLTWASVPYSLNVADSSYNFDIGTLPAGRCGVIRIVDSVACGAIGAAGQFCTRAWLTPANRLQGQGGCLARPAGYDGSDITIRSECRQDSIVRFTLRNQGDGPMAAQRRYRIYLDTALAAEGTFRLGPGDSVGYQLTLKSAQLGLSVRAEADQAPEHPFARRASTVQFCPEGFWNTGMALDDERPDVDVDCQTAVGSYDPNDKHVFPKGLGQAGNVLPETLLEYRIRFQNTGTDTAYKIVVADTLSPDLDLASLELGTASHAYKFQVAGVGRPALSFTFSNIRLVDSLHNEPASHGYVSFRIRPKKGLALGTRIENKAYIYFDFNPPVPTNTTVNTLYMPAVDTGVTDTLVIVSVQKPASRPFLTVRPNPAQSQVTVTAPRTGVVELYSLQGRRLLAIPTQAGKPQTLSLKDVPPGLYLLRQQEHTLRIVKQ